MSGCVVVGVVMIMKGWVYGGCRSRSGDEEQSGVHSQLWGGAVMSSGGWREGCVEARVDIAVKGGVWMESYLVYRIYVIHDYVIYL